jgi:hypothetical protein
MSDEFDNVVLFKSLLGDLLFAGLTAFIREFLPNRRGYVYEYSLERIGAL